MGSAMALVSSAMSVGLILGPLLGGIIYARRGYYPAFGLAFAFIGIDLVLRIILVEKKIAIKYTSASSTILQEEATRTVKLQALPSDFADSEGHIPSALPVESPIANLMGSKIPPVIRILKYPRLLVALFLSLVQALILSAFDATLPLYLNALFGFTALQAGEPMAVCKLMARSNLYGNRPTCVLYLACRRLVMRPLRSQNPRLRRPHIFYPLPSPSSHTSCGREQPSRPGSNSLCNFSISR